MKIIRISTEQLLKQRLDSLILRMKVEKGA